MALVVKDRVKVSSTTTGTGTFTLGSAAIGFQDFSVIGDGNTTYYTIAGVGTSEFEVGIGTFTASGTTLSRDTILESSNAGSAVNFSAGIKDVFVTYPAERAVYTDAAGTAITPATASTLGVLSGGTGQTTYINGQLLIGNTTGNTLTKATLTAGTGISVTNGTGSITVAATNNGTVTSVSGTGTVQGLSLSGTVTSSGNLTLGGSLSAVSLTTQVSGTLPAGNGGTGITSLGTGVATWLGTPSSANLRSAVTDETGTGSLVFATTPTLVTPILGTPTSGTLTNCTGLPVSTGVSGLGANVATFLGTPSSANLAATVTDETGSGALVFATSPTLTTPNLGTPSAATLTNATGLPIVGGTTGTLSVARGGTGITSFGSGIATFLGTPSSANLAAALTDETGSGSVVFSASPTFTGTVSAEGINISSFIDLADNDILRFGTSDDMEIYHNGTDNYVDLNVGNLIFRDNTTTRLTLARSTGDLTVTGDINCQDKLVDRPVLHDYAVDGVNKGTLSGAETLDLSTGNYFYGSAVTGAITWTFSNPPGSGDFGCFVLELINGGAYTQTWPASVDWPGGTAPTLTASGKDQLVFTTRDAGTTWLGFVAGLDIK